MQCPSPTCGAQNDDGSKFCHKCGTSLLPTKRGGGGDGGSKIFVTGKNPTTALVLSLVIPGFAIGQFYNGDVKKGVAMLVGTLILGPLTAGVVWLGIWIWSVIDAQSVASGKSAIW